MTPWSTAVEIPFAKGSPVLRERAADGTPLGAGQLPPQQEVELEFYAGSGGVKGQQGPPPTLFIKLKEVVISKMRPAHHATLASESTGDVFYLEFSEIQWTKGGDHLGWISPRVRALPSSRRRSSSS